MDGYLNPWMYNFSCNINSRLCWNMPPGFTQPCDVRKKRSENNDY